VDSRHADRRRAPMELSEYEEQRLRNISQNQEILAKLGLDETTLKRVRGEEPRQPRAPRPRLKMQKTRLSFRHHGLQPDAKDEEVDSAMQAAVAGPSRASAAPPGPAGRIPAWTARRFPRACRGGARVVGLDLQDARTLSPHG
jgi:hypothetical protein